MWLRHFWNLFLCCIPFSQQANRLPFAAFVAAFFCCMLLVHDIANASTFFTAYNINSSGWTLTFHHRFIVCYGVTIAAMTVQVCERFPCISDSFLSGVSDISFVSYSSAARLCANYAKCTNPIATVGIYTQGQQHLNALYCH